MLGSSASRSPDSRSGHPAGTRGAVLPIYFAPGAQDAGSLLGLQLAKRRGPTDGDQQSEYGAAAGTRRMDDEWNGRRWRFGDVGRGRGITGDVVCRSSFLRSGGSIRRWGLCEGDVEDLDLFHCRVSLCPSASWASFKTTAIN